MLTFLWVPCSAATLRTTVAQGGDSGLRKPSFSARCNPIRATTGPAGPDDGAHPGWHLALRQDHRRRTCSGTRPDQPDRHPWQGHQSGPAMVRQRPDLYLTPPWSASDVATPHKDADWPGPIEGGHPASARRKALLRQVLHDLCGGKTPEENSLLVPQPFLLWVGGKPRLQEDRSDRIRQIILSPPPDAVTDGVDPLDRGCHDNRQIVKAWDQFHGFQHGETVFLRAFARPSAQRPRSGMRRFPTLPVRCWPDRPSHPSIPSAASQTSGSPDCLRRPECSAAAGPHFGLLARRGFGRNLRHHCAAYGEFSPIAQKVQQELAQAHEVGADRARSLIVKDLGNIETLFAARVLI